LTDLAARPPTAALLLAAALLAGCANRVSDPPVKPLADVCGGGIHITSTLGGPNGPAPWEQDANSLSKNCPYPQEQTVYVSCLSVTAVDNWDETGDGAVGTVYVQDNLPTIPIYAGTSLFGTSFSPPDLRLEPGNVIDVTGTYEEWSGPSSLATGAFQYCETLPQIAGAGTYRFDGAVPTPVVIQPADLDNYGNGRKYMNMLVTVQNVQIAAAPSSSSGRYSAPVVVPPGGQPWSIGNPLFDLPNQKPLVAGDQFPSVTGIVTWFEGYTLAPRSVADFQEPGQPAPDGG
jgi:hypothetical protein